MRLNKVTITGADDSISPASLHALSIEFPFVEWGILVHGPYPSYSRRFPSNEWISEMVKLTPRERLSAHLCSGAAHDFIAGAPMEWAAGWDLSEDAFSRIQVNFHGEMDSLDPKFADNMDAYRDHQFILQVDGRVDGPVLDIVRDNVAVPLFDESGGGGILPIGGWPSAVEGVYCGYAGGLGPENVVDNIRAISAQRSDQHFWIDMETHVRSDNDTLFDLDKVKSVLTLASPFIESPDLGHGVRCDCQ